MNDVKLQKIMEMLINSPRLPPKFVAKRCRATEDEVDKVISLMVKFASKGR